MLTKIVQVYLYTANTTEEACTQAKQWLEANGVEYTLLHYGDEAQHPDTLGALNSWFGTNFTQFPIVTYDEIYDDQPSQRAYIYGLTALTQSNLAELYQLGR